ncbi:hypothetical protein RhiJN_02144 [Ceratobasidium sp. AG-Ba]|nr:hypothetical protein RhiJN_02144 [Ceratobasidium sp. AG-Ba]QRW03076.1 hypothetical protein RhiLY_02075 [Ceratobasidium sp. AG-Ba]
MHPPPGGSAHHPGATPNYMTPRTPRTPKTPDEYGSLAKKAGFSHRQPRTREERMKDLMERVRRHGAKKRNGNAFDLPPLSDDISRANELVRLRETYGTYPMDNLESLRALGRLQEAETTPPDYPKIAQERQTIYKEGVRRMAEQTRRERIQDAYVDVLVGYEEEEWHKRPIPVGSSRSSKLGQNPNQQTAVVTPMVVLEHELKVLKTRHDDIRERLDYANSKTIIAIRGTGKNQNKLAEQEARRRAEVLDKVPTSFQAWKALDESRQVRIGRFLQLPDDQKDAEVEKRQWSREDAMALYQAFRSEPEFQAELNSLLAKRMTTDPRRRPTSNPPGTTPGQP